MKTTPLLLTGLVFVLLELSNVSIASNEQNEAPQVTHCSTDKSISEQHCKKLSDAFSKLCWARVWEFSEKGLRGKELKAQDCVDPESSMMLSDQQQEELLNQHLYYFVPPSDRTIIVRRAYVMEYNADARIPRWAAWYAKKAFLDTPKREGRWNKFQQDDSVDSVLEPVVENDYKNSGFSRGHIVPYYISGGDRNNNGMDAECEKLYKLPVEDPYDACTVFEVNLMTNVSPQLGSEFNSGSGSWKALEDQIRKLIKNGNLDFHLIAGPVFINDSIEVIDLKFDIHVPHAFFKIVIHEHNPVAFLFAHFEPSPAIACKLGSKPENCIVSVDEIEELTGLDFFNKLSQEEQVKLEKYANRKFWKEMKKKGDK